MKKKRIALIIAIVSCILFGIILFSSGSFAPKTQMVIWNALQTFLNEANQSMKIDAHIELGEEEIDLKSKMYRVAVEDVNYLVFEQSDFPVYVVDNILLLENGKAFKISDTVPSKEENDEDETPEMNNLFQKIVAVYKGFEFTTKEVGKETRHSVVVTGDLVEQILADVIPMERETIGTIERLKMVLVTKGEKMVRLELRGGSDINGKDVEMEVVLSEFKVLKPEGYKIPEVVSQSLKNINEDELFCLSKDLYPLLMASQSFKNLADRNGVVRVEIDFGLIQLDTTVDIDEMKKGTDKVENSQKVQDIPSWLSVLFLEGDISVSSEVKKYTYSLALDAESTQKIAEMMIPNLHMYQFEFTQSEAKLVVKGDEIASIAISINGEVDVFISEIPLKIEMEYMFE